MNNKKILLFITLSVMVLFSACKKEANTHTHTFADATCTTPKTCTECKYTEGGTADHSFNQATCTSPKKCMDCGEKEGTAIGHSTTLGKCSRCNVFQGQSAWNSIWDDYSSASDYILDGSEYFTTYLYVDVNSAKSMAQNYFGWGKDKLESMYDRCAKHSSLSTLLPKIQAAIDSIPKDRTISTKSQLSEYIDDCKTLMNNMTTLSTSMSSLANKFGN